MRISRTLTTPSCEISQSDDEIAEHLKNGFIFPAASPVMAKICSSIERVARVDVPVLLLGESGVGKEVVAHRIHQLSKRADRSFLKVNCAALPGELLESELFGYETGAFTGATRSKPGKFELANHGTILLDELGEMNPVLQAKLLHVLQDGQFCRLGGRTNITADVRVLAATNINIEKAIAQKMFRDDLYYRLNAFTMNIPPLRERREEIPALLKHFMTRFSRKYSQAPLPYSDRLLAACLNYHWPGNLRELGNFVKRYLVLQDEHLAVFELQEKSRSSSFVPAILPRMGGIPGRDLKSLVRSSRDETELKAIEEALAATKWNRKMAAAKLHISYKA